MVSSAAYPGLERKPGGPDNWVERVGGLPKYIERIAKHLHYEKGMDIGHAIATAVNTVKRWARKGTVVKYNDPETHHVTTITAAQASAAVAEWESKKARARAGRSARMGRRSIGLSEDSVQALVERAGRITDPQARAAARQSILDLVAPPAGAEVNLALPKTQSCKYCAAPATKRILHSEGHAYTPVCDGHLAKGKDDAVHSTPDGTADPTNIVSITDLSNEIDLALTKDGRKSFKRNGGRYRHGFIPINDKAVTAKAKGSPIARRRITRLFRGGGGGAARRAVPPTPHKAKRSLKPKSVTLQTSQRTSEKVASLAQARRIPIKDATRSQRVAESQDEASRGTRRKRRSFQSWDKIPDEQKTVRNGKKYTLTTYKGKTQLTEWVGQNDSFQTAPDTAKRRLASLRAVDAENWSTAKIRKMLKVPGQPKAVKKVLNEVLRQKVAAGGKKP